MKFIAVKSGHVAIAAALAAGLFSVSAANAARESCRSSGIKPSCTTAAIPVVASAKVNFLAAAGGQGDTQARGNFKILRGTTAIYTKAFSGEFPLTGLVKVPTTASYKASVSSTRQTGRSHVVTAIIENY